MKVKGYLRYRRSMLSAAAVAFVVFPSIIWLAGAGMTTALYAAGIYAFILAVFIMIDIPRYSGKVKRLGEIAENLSHTTHDYPEQENNIEQLYSSIIEALYALMDEERLAIVEDYSEQVDYYTMWLHQIKTPIAAMRLALDSGESCAQICERELFDIERYVEMALQYVKLRGISGDLRIAPTELDEVLRGCIKKYSVPFIYKNLSVDFEPTGLVVTTDAKWLAFITEQLLGNAVKYTNEGGVKIYAVGRGFAVSDSGIGIRSEDLERIFEKGYTGFNGRLDKRASGLGLYMAREIASRLGITIKAASKVGEGTTMTVEFGAQAH